MREVHDHLRPPRYEDMTREEQRQHDNAMDEEMFFCSARRLIDNGQCLSVCRIWQDDIMPLLPKTMRAA